MMKKVLVPISFSASSENALRQAVSIFDKGKLTLLNVYPTQTYSREYDFGKKKCSVGIREKLRTF